MQLKQWFVGTSRIIIIPEHLDKARLDWEKELERRDYHDYIRVLARLRRLADYGPQRKWFKTLHDCNRLVQLEGYRGRVIFRPHPSNAVILIVVHMFIKQTEGTDHPQLDLAKKRDKVILAKLKSEESQ